MSDPLHSEKDVLEVQFAQTLPVGELSTYQLGLLLQHRVNLDSVMPRSIDLVVQEPFVKTESSVPGSLLRLILLAGASWLTENPRERERLDKTLHWVRIALEDTAAAIAKFDAGMEASNG